MTDSPERSGNSLEKSGKIVLITGANSGIGKEAVRAIATMGNHVVMVSRSREKGESVQAELRSATGSDDIDLMLCDFASQTSIRQFAAEFIERYPRLDVLVNNAGAVNGARVLTPDGYETTFAVNHLGYFLLTNLMLGLLQKSAPARVVNVASTAAGGATINFDDLNGEKNYSGGKAYGQSKLANILFTYELARRLQGTGVTANCLHPGVVATNFGSDGPAILRLFLPLGRRFLLTAAQGAATIIYLAVSPEVEGVTGKYFEKCKEVKSPAASYDGEVAKRLWQVSAEMTGGLG